LQSANFAEMSAAGKPLEQTDAILPEFESPFFVGQLVVCGDSIFRIASFFTQCVCLALSGQPCICPRADAEIKCDIMAVNELGLIYGPVSSAFLKNVVPLSAADTTKLVDLAAANGGDLTAAQRFPKRALRKLALMYWTGLCLTSDFLSTFSVTSSNVLL
jgi:hypothetical protein